MSNDSDDQLVEVGAPVIADLQTTLSMARVKRTAETKNTLTAASDFHRQTSKFHSRALEILGGKIKILVWRLYERFFSRIGKNLKFYWKVLHYRGVAI